MKKELFISLLLFFSFVSSAKDINSFSGNQFFYHGMYYRVGEYRSNSWNTTNKSVTLYKSSDLSRWEYVGTIFDSKKINGLSIERPKVFFKNNKFIMWFHAERNSNFKEGYIGVATSNKVEGPYILKKIGNISYSKPPLSSDDSLRKDWSVIAANKIYKKYQSKGFQVRDFSIFIENNDYYIVYVSEDNYSLHIAKLNKDLTSISNYYARVLVGYRNEAPVITKINGKYILIMSGVDGYHLTNIRYAISDSLFSGWKIHYDNSIKQSCIGQPAFVYHNHGEAYLVTDIWDFSGGYLGLYKSGEDVCKIELNNNKVSLISQRN